MGHGGHWFYCGYPDVLLCRLRYFDSLGIYRSLFHRIAPTLRGIAHAYLLIGYARVPSAPPRSYGHCSHVQCRYWKNIVVRTYGSCSRHYSGRSPIARTIKKIEAKPLKEFYNTEPIPEEKLPSTSVSILTALSPIIFIGVGIAAEQFLEEGLLQNILTFIGNPVIALLISVLIAIYSLGLAKGKEMSTLMDSLSSSVSSITMILLIIAGAGALKEVLIDSQVSEYIADSLIGSSVSPLILAWLIATAIRVSVGSATVAGLTAAGIVLPLASGTGTSPELMVLAIGSGSLMLSHVNDTGFWMFKEYFNLSVKETLSTWTVMETLVGIMGLIGVLVINSII